MAERKSLALGALFGVIIFSTKILLPTPVDKMFILIHSLLLALGFLLIGRMGATYVAATSGLLVTVWRPAFAPFSLIFDVLYGLMVDSTSQLFKVKAPSGDVKTARLVASLALSTAATGLISTYVTTSIGLMPWMPLLYYAILVVGVVNGVVAGFAASFIYSKYLIHYVK